VEPRHSVISERHVRRTAPRKFWSEIINFNALVRYGTISPEDVDLFHLMDSIDDAYAIITRELAQPRVASPAAWRPPAVVERQRVTMPGLLSSIVVRPSFVRTRLMARAVPLAGKLIEAGD
jgi:hypothetical protein